MELKPRPDPRPPATLVALGVVLWLLLPDSAVGPAVAIAGAVLAIALGSYLLWNARERR